MQPTLRISRQRGATIVELVVVITVLAIILPVFVYALLNGYRDAYTSHNRNEVANKAAIALAAVESRVRSAREYLVSLPADYTDPYGPNNTGTSWSFKGSADKNVLILDQYATSTNMLGSERKPVYRSDGAFSCVTEKYYLPELHYVTILFVRNNTLYQRTVTNTTAPLCPGDQMAQKQSCPPELQASWNAVCQVRDEILSTNVTAFTVEYYQNNNPASIIDAYPSNDPDILQPADYILVNITTTTDNGSLTNTALMRMSKGNS